MAVSVVTAPSPKNSSVSVAVRVTLVGQARPAVQGVFRRLGLVPPPFPPPHEDVSLCQEAELDRTAGVLGELPAFVSSMQKKPGTGPRSPSQNYITIIPLSVSEAS